MLTICLVLATAVLVLLVLVYVLQAAHEDVQADLRGRLNVARAEVRRLKRVVAAVEAEVDAPVPFTLGRRAVPDPLDAIPATPGVRRIHSAGGKDAAAIRYRKGC